MNRMGVAAALGCAAGVARSREPAVTAGTVERSMPTSGIGNSIQGAGTAFAAAFHGGSSLAFADAVLAPKNASSSEKAMSLRSFQP